MTIFSPDLPVAIIGAGPVGLAAAAHLVARGIQPVILECGQSVGASLLEWAHVRVFSPWRYNVDAAARTLLDQAGWQAPDPEALPNGGELVAQYLKPLASLPRIAANLKLGATVTGITREGRDKVGSEGREQSAFVVRYADGDGAEHRVRARAVIDASGTWTQPNPMGVDGLSVPGEAAVAGRIAYGIPDVVHAERERYAGKRVLVVGSGHSAINVALALMELQQDDPRTEIFWALRRNSIERLLGGGLNDQLPERGALGLAAKAAMQDGRLRMLAPFAAQHLSPTQDGVRVEATLGGEPFEIDVGRIVVTTGFRPDLSFLRELRVELDPTVEAPPKLAPLIDPNFHSCGTVPAHGIDELSHPEPGFAIVGSKSYGRAPTFLMATGYEQVRSVVAELAGDHLAARVVELALPETGVCSAAPAVGEAASGCCGGPTLARTDACCVADAKAKDAGKSGCGCGTKSRDMAAAE
ncbi:NAD(P)-binding domain-containing protein [Mesorhizobium sp. KR9-304]|uniref:NAD(P)-binding domain-containing protein n=1 Tax=Mesorhizobium sp. KR9-304 TaxID=3156614 RepID=UPI0032B47C2B